MDDCPRLLADFEPIRGTLKQDYEDFHVTELPLYPFSGSGWHTYFLLEKRGLATLQAVSDVARALGVARRDIGYAGLKDARAVTRQWMSVANVPEEQLRALDVPRLRVLDVTRHGNKLKLGHLRANQFRIRIRIAAEDTARVAEFQAALERLARAGAPNYFGPQRFGIRGDSWMTGRAIVRGDMRETLDCMLGRPLATDDANLRQARERYEAGRFAEAAELWPGMFRDERRALKALAGSGGNVKRGFLAVDESVRHFLVSAYQSHLFNRIVAQRLPTGLGRLQTGDLAWRHANGAVFLVTDPSVEQPRADALEISPSGPLFGYRMTPAEGEPGAAEAAVLESEGLDPQMWREHHLRVKGMRRPLRIPIADATSALGADARGNYLEVGFTLSRGAYATSVLRELVAEPPSQGTTGDSGSSEDDSEE